MSFLAVGRKEEEKEKARPKEKQASKSETSLGEVWKMALSLIAVGGRIGCVSTLHWKDCREERR